jgi:hypothetical protein
MLPTALITSLHLASGALCSKRVCAPSMMPLHATPLIGVLRLIIFGEACSLAVSVTPQRSAIYRKRVKFAPRPLSRWHIEYKRGKEKPWGRPMRTWYKRCSPQIMAELVIRNQNPEDSARLFLWSVLRDHVSGMTCAATSTASVPAQCKSGTGGQVLVHHTSYDMRQSAKYWCTLLRNAT